MPNIVADMVDAYVFRKINARLQFLLLLRRPDVPFGNTWQSVHQKIDDGDTAVAAARNAIFTSTGLTPTEAYSADFINQVYDHRRDAIVLAPVFAFTVPPGSTVQLNEEFSDSAWCEREEASARLLWSGQRWAVRHIDDIIGLGSSDAEFYRVD